MRRSCCMAGVAVLLLLAGCGGKSDNQGQNQGDQGSTQAAQSQAAQQPSENPAVTPPDTAKGSMPAENSTQSAEPSNTPAAGQSSQPSASQQPSSEPPASTDHPTPTTGKKAHTTASGLKYFDLKAGTGASPHSGQSVTVHYTGWLTNGSKFDSSVDRGQPFTFTIGQGQVIPGWDEGVMSMKVGGKRQLVIPPSLGYGERGTPGGPIPPNATLIFDVELLGVQ